MKIDKTGYFRYGLLGVSILFFCFWFFFDGIRIAVDAGSYENFSMSREPLYPVFLAIFRNIFGQEYYAVIGFVQSILWAFSIWYLCDVLYREMKLNRLSFVVLLILNFFLCMSTRFLTGRKSFYSLDIGSEGIAIPLFLLFATELFLYLFKQKNRNLIGVVIYGILLLSVRKQMYIVVLIMGILFTALWLFRQIKFKKLIILCLITIATFIGAVLFDIGYNLIIRGEAVRHSTDSSALLINAVFVATEDDAINIKDEGARELFLDIIRMKEENGWGYESAENGLRNLADHYADNFDNIAFEVVNPLFYDFLDRQGIEDYVERELTFGELNDYMFGSVVKDNVFKMLHVFVANVIKGACNTVAKDSDMLIPAIVFLYMVFVGMGAYLSKKQKLIPEVWFGILTAVCIIINVVAVSAMIFSQSRYMIYNMPLFYCSLYVMARKIYEIILKKRMNL